MMKLKWNGPRIKRNCLPVDGIFTHPIAGQCRVLVNPDQRRISIITTNGALVDTFYYDKGESAITLKRLSPMLEVRGLVQG